MFRIGVVGSSLSVNLILEMAREMEQEMEFIPCVYQETSEIEEILLSNDQQVDFWQNILEKSHLTLVEGQLKYMS